MLRCREVVEVVSDGKELPAWKKPSLWFHLAICSACRLYMKQVNLLKEQAKKIAHRYEDQAAESDLVEKIKKQIK